MVLALTTREGIKRASLEGKNINSFWNMLGLKCSLNFKRCTGKHRYTNLEVKSDMGAQNINLSHLRNGI